ncbi:MAG: hypothetical protein COT85_03880 [Chlamydiae bacterium CG10_big_fil_rev_8_21_14_0_10_42_34]|nr:MAG: hypothetical protein COT85_03880 [Chlamydiae bacterium CG10_big_fil_rev_8_21_14_0_10_42_34]
MDVSRGLVGHQGKVFLPEYDVQLSARDKKVMAVALASLGFFGLQMGLGLVLTVSVTTFLSAMTYLAEVHLRNGSENDWFRSDFDKKKIAFWTAFLLVRPFILRIALSLLGLPMPVIPQTGIAEKIFSQPWKMIPLATIVAPFTEEILFRGVLLERFEDTLAFFNRKQICKLSENAQKKISNMAQAVLFGAAHLGSKIQEGMVLPVWGMLSFMGYVSGLLKNEMKGSLIPSTIFHSANNVSALMMIHMSYHPKVAEESINALSDS